jgi:hypothetical protein
LIKYFLEYIVQQVKIYRKVVDTLIVMIDEAALIDTELCSKFNLNAISSVVYCLICMIKYFLVEVMSVLS